MCRFEAAQEHVEFRLEERAETEFAQDGFVRQRRELVDDLGALGAGDTDACSLGKQRRAPDLHIAPIPAMLADHVDHAPAFRACAVEQFTMWVRWPARPSRTAELREGRNRFACR